MGSYISFVIDIFAVFKRFSADIYIVNFVLFGSADAFPFGKLVFFIFFEGTVVASKPVARNGGFIDLTRFKGVFSFIKHIFADASFIVLFFIINIFPGIAFFGYIFAAIIADSRMGSVVERFIAYQIIVSAEISVADIAVNRSVFAGAKFLHMSLTFFVITGMVAVFIGAKSFDKFLTFIAVMVAVFIYADVNLVLAYITNGIGVLINMVFYNLIAAGVTIFIMFSS